MAYGGYVVATTALVVLCCCATTAFVGGGVPRQPTTTALHTGTAAGAPAVALDNALGVSGLVGFGAGFGLLAAMLHQRRTGSRVQRRAAEIEVAEKTEAKVVPYLQKVPRSIIEKGTLDKLLTTVPREQWDNPPEDSYLYTLKQYAETYGEGKATKMGWWDFWYMKINSIDADEFYSGEEIEENDQYIRKMCTGQYPLYIPGPSGVFYTGATIQWRGPEAFAGDQVQSPVTAGGWAVQYVNNMAFYRPGLKPWQRGLEIGIAHGYWIIGPFVALGPLRNTPEAATVGLLCGIAVIGIASCGGLLSGAIRKPTNFDEEGQTPGSGWTEMMNWHALGGIGGAAFAHLLITVFGSS